MRKYVFLIAAIVGFNTTNAQVAGNDKIAVGQVAPELEYATPDGKTLKLSEVYKNRVVLIDFWASWCGPCRGANPRLVKMYNEFQGKKMKGAKKGFTILSVSLDKNKEAWLKAIEKDSLKWEYHMSDLGGWQSKAAEQYGVQFIPQAFLVGADGKVINKYMFAEQAAEDLKKLEIQKKKKKFLLF